MRTLKPAEILDYAVFAAASVLLLRLLVVAGLVLALTGGRPGPGELLILTAKPLAFAAAAAAVAAWRARSREALRRGLRASALAGIALAAWPPGWIDTRENALGLASRCADCVQDHDYSGSEGKDGYPSCRFRNNSLGYRDVEPAFPPDPSRRRVLLVGDSYVWGDGIPDNAETLGYLLRADLERLAPGRFTVMSAAHPGLGLYGYLRFIDVLSERYRPDAVVVGYLGANDHDPFDPQLILERLPRGGPVRNLLLNLGAAQHVHAASVENGERIWGSERGRGFIAAAFRGLSANALADGYRLLFLSYFPHEPLPEPIETLELPERLRYQGRASDLWYAKDFHPKTALNRQLSRALAERLSR
ncbi:MAG: SGNH/GDSL hydrolase family protein [Elusimicrobiota bacterium]|nr:SGNH/GDSL hydrolase family protein [Elusimicrobiota bacterium]